MLEYYFIHTFDKSKVALSMLYQMLIYSISVLFIIYGDIIFFINNFSSKHSSGADTGVSLEAMAHPWNFALAKALGSA